MTFVVMLTAFTSASSLWAQPASFAEAASQARRSVVTVRVTLPIVEQPKASATDIELEPKDVAEPKHRVLVSTGLAVTPRMIVTSAFASTDSVIRVTTASGGRDEASMRVIDEYSGLMLIETESLELQPVTLGSADLAAGEWVLAAAGWGAEAPVVSFGVVSGIDRQQPGYPPLLQLDVRTVSTSSGAAVLDAKGKLQGVVVAVENVRPQGLTYAVPTRHVERLLRVWANRPGRKAASPPAKPDRDPPQPAGKSKGGAASTSEADLGETGETIVLRRRRPEAGLVLQGGNDGGMPLVVVQRVHKGGPADLAGFKVGDEVLSVDGVLIRSVYEAVRPVLSRQPGDMLTYRVQNADGVRDVALVLGGGVALDNAPLKTVSSLIRPKLDIEGLPSGIRMRPTKPDFLVNADGDRPQPAADTAAKLLERAMEGYLRVIAVQQEELRKIKQQRSEDKRQLETLQRQLAELKKQQEKAPAAPASK